MDHAAGAIVGTSRRCLQCGQSPRHASGRNEKVMIVVRNQIAACLIFSIRHAAKKSDVEREAVQRRRLNVADGSMR